MRYEFYKYPLDFLEKYRNGIEKIGAPDVARVAAKYLHKAQLKVLVVGNTAEFDKSLSTLGPVKTLDISIPPPPGGGSEPTGEPANKPTASNPEGRALAAKVVQAMGGLAKLKAIKAVKQDITSTEQDGSHMPIQVTIAFPDRMRADVQTPNGKLVLAVTPEVGFMSIEGAGVRRLAGLAKERIHGADSPRSDLHRAASGRPDICVFREGHRKGRQCRRANRRCFRIRCHHYAGLSIPRVGASCKSPTTRWADRVPPTT